MVRRVVRRAFRDFLIIRLITYFTPILVVGALWLAGHLEDATAVDLLTGMLDVNSLPMPGDGGCRQYHKLPHITCDRTGPY